MTALPRADVEEAAVTAALTAYGETQEDCFTRMARALAARDDMLMITAIMSRCRLYSAAPCRIMQARLGTKTTRPATRTITSACIMRIHYA